MNSTESPDDGGLTLVEIVIYMTISLFIASIVTFMLINTFRSQGDVTSVTTATTRGQVAAQGIERAVRNATGLQVSPDGARLEVATTLTPKCQAWRVKNGVLQSSTTTKFLESTWYDVVGDTPDDEDRVSLLPEKDPAVEPAFFSKDGAILKYGFAVETDSSLVKTDGRPVAFAGQVLPRATGDSVAAACY